MYFFSAMNTPILIYAGKDYATPKHFSWPSTKPGLVHSWPGITDVGSFVHFAEALVEQREVVAYVCIAFLCVPPDVTQSFSGCFLGAYSTSVVYHKAVFKTSCAFFVRVARAHTSAS